MRPDDDLDLSALLRPVPPPPDGPSRARRTARRRRVARRATSGTLAALVVVAGLAAVRSYDDESSPTVSAGPGPSGAMLVVTRGFDDRVGELWGALVDVETGSSVPVELPVSHDSQGLGLLAREGGVVMTSESSVWVLPPPYTGRARPLGSAVRVVPSIRPDSVWLVLEGNLADETRAGTARLVVEMDVEGRVVTPPVELPCCRELVGESSRGLVLRTSDARVEVWDVARGRAVVSFDDVSGINDVRQDTVLFSNNGGCGEFGVTAYILDLLTGERRQLGAPCSSYGGDRWSPDGRTVARWIPWDGAASTLFLLDPSADGAPMEVPRSTSAEYVLAWDAHGRMYFAGFDGQTVWSHDRSTGATQAFFRDPSGHVYALALAR